MRDVGSVLELGVHKYAVAGVAGPAVRYRVIATSLLAH